MKRSRKILLAGAALSGVLGAAYLALKRSRRARPKPYGVFGGAVATEKQMEVGGIPMRWLEHSHGQAVVLVHGIPTGPLLWRKVLPRLRGARALAWEMVGYGTSIPAGRGRDISVARQGVVLYYPFANPEANSAEITRLEAVTRGFSKTIIAPLEDLKSGYVLAAWQRLQRFDSVEAAGMTAFLGTLGESTITIPYPLEWVVTEYSDVGVPLQTCLPGSLAAPASLEWLEYVLAFQAGQLEPYARS